MVAIEGASACRRLELLIVTRRNLQRNAPVQA